MPYPATSGEVEKTVEAILATGKLSPTAARLLKYLASRRPEEPARAADIARELWPDAKTDENAATRVRVMLSRIRHDLDRYFRNNGSDFDLKISVSQRGYQLIFEAPHIDPVKRLWKPYASSQKTLVVLEEPLFFRTPDQLYVRSLNVNHPSEQHKVLKDIVRSKELTPSFHYLSAGEVLGAMKTIQEFAQWSIKTELCTIQRTSGLPATDPARQANLVVLGTPRSNSLIKLFEEGRELQLTNEGITSVAPPRHTFRDFFERRTGDKGGYVLVTRCGNLSTAPTTTTVISSNRSQTLRFVTDSLFDRNVVEQIVSRLGSTTTALPEEFQLVFRVTLAPGYGETLCSDVSLVDARALRPARTPQSYDVVLIHGRKDRAAAASLAKQLRAKGVTPWCDFESLRPGESWVSALESLRSVPIAVLIGSAEGPWQREEIRAFISRTIESGGTVIPVLLDRLRNKPLPPMLAHLEGVDLHEDAERAFDRLIWGITGRNPSSST